MIIPQMDYNEHHSLNSAVWHLKTAAVFRKQRDFAWTSQYGECVYEAQTFVDKEFDPNELDDGDISI